MVWRIQHVMTQHDTIQHIKVNLVTGCQSLRFAQNKLHAIWYLAPSNCHHMCGLQLLEEPPVVGDHYN